MGQPSAKSRVWIWVAGLVVLATVLLWKPLTQSTTPRGLFEMTLEFYEEAPHLNPFESNRPPHPVRLVGVSLGDARAALSRCKLSRWAQLGTAEKQFADDPLSYHWECRSGSTIVRASEMWEPHMGIDGIDFAACDLSACPSFEQSFDHDFYAREELAISEVGK